MRAMPSPTWRTVPTSARSVWIENSSMRCLRIEVISSGFSFTGAPFPTRGQVVQCDRRQLLCVIASPDPGLASRREFSSPSVQAAADARGQTDRAGPQDDPGDQARVDRSRDLDLAARGPLDLGHDRARLLVGQLVRGRQLDGQLALLRRDHSLELARDLLDLAGAALLGEQAQEVRDELVA